MPQFRATRTFGTDKGKFGMVRTGTVLTMSLAEAAAFNRANRGILVPFEPPNAKAVDEAPKTPEIPAAPRDKHVPRAPHSAPPAPPRVEPEPETRKGNEERPSDETAPDLEADRPADGRTLTSSSVRPARRSKRKT